MRAGGDWNSGCLFFLIILWMIIEFEVVSFERYYYVSVDYTGVMLA